jgi:hypothetical protein
MIKQLTRAGTQQVVRCTTSRLRCEKRDRLLFKDADNRDHDGRIL